MNSATNSVPEIVGGGLSPRQLQIEQTGAGSTVKYHGMYVAKDAVAKLTGKRVDHTADKIKIMMDAPANEARFQSRKNVPSGHSKVLFTQLFCTASTDCTQPELSG